MMVGGPPVIKPASFSQVLTAIVTQLSFVLVGNHRGKLLLLACTR
jgi:hypothetical protein